MESAINGMISHGGMETQLKDVRSIAAEITKVRKDLKRHFKALSDPSRPVKVKT